MGHAIVAGGARASVPVTGIKLGDIAVGQLVKINENGSPVEFYVAKHDYESALNGARRTLLVRKDCYDTRAWNTVQVNTLEGSTIDSWLNESYKKLLYFDTQSVIKPTKFYYTPGGGNKRVTTLERSIFLLSITELGRVNSWANTEGSTLPIAGNLQIAYYNGSAVRQWTRSPHLNANTTYVCYLSLDGSFNYDNSSYIYGARPCFTFPSGAMFDAKTLIFNGKVAG